MEISAYLTAALPQALPRRLGVAVSGGGDSMALLHLLSTLPDPPQLFAVTVNHGLRQGAAREAEMVAEFCRKLNCPHDILRWGAGPTEGNLQAQAREARYGLIRAWAQQHDIQYIALGHSLDDQAETVLMRLSREAGVTGLAAMRPSRTDHDVIWLRPLLDVGREDLRAYLRHHDISWVDDPSNDDDRFHRIRLRKALDDLGVLGITRTGLASVATHMARAEDALAQQTAAAAADIGRLHLGDVELDRAGLSALPQEIARRLLVQAMTEVTGPGYPPRTKPLMAALDHALAGRAATLGGCLIMPRGALVRVTREWAAVKDLRPVGAVWDRWHVEPLRPGDAVTGLGEAGLAHVPHWRDTGAPRQALITSPGVWRNGELVAAPVAGWANGYICTSLNRTGWFPLSQSH